MWSIGEGFHKNETEAREEKPMIRLLLPFTSGVEMDVLDSLVRFASHQHATLIPLSLVPLPAKKRKGVRLELLQQSKDFLEAVHYKAERHQLPTEPVELFTRDVVESILAYAEQVHCDGILLAARPTRGSLLDMETIQQLLQAHPCALFVVYFPAKKRGNWLRKGRASLARWWPGEQEPRASQRDAGYAAPANYQVLAPRSDRTQTAQAEQEGVPLNAGEHTTTR